MMKRIPLIATALIGVLVSAPLWAAGGAGGADQKYPDVIAVQVQARCDDAFDFDNGLSNARQVNAPLQGPCR